MPWVSKGWAQSHWSLPTGMTVEVLGTVLGTAIQGQIVGQVVTPCIESPRFIGMTNSSVAMEELNVTRNTGSLTDTVSWGDLLAAPATLSLPVGPGWLLG